MNLYSLPLHTNMTEGGLLPLEQPASTSMSPSQVITHAGLCTMLCSSHTHHLTFWLSCKVSFSSQNWHVGFHKTSHQLGSLQELPDEERCVSSAWTKVFCVYSTSVGHGGAQDARCYQAEQACMLCYTVEQNNITVHLVPGLLLLLPEQGPQRDAGDLGHLQHDSARASAQMHRHRKAGASQLGWLLMVPGGGGVEGSTHKASSCCLLCSDVEPVLASGRPAAGLGCMCSTHHGSAAGCSPDREQHPGWSYDPCTIDPGSHHRRSGKPDSHCCRK